MKKFIVLAALCFANISNAGVIFWGSNGAESLTPRIYFPNGSYVDGSAGASGITTLNTQTGASQTFATGSVGTDFGISSSTNVHTFNIPTASAANRGLLSSADWTTFNNKGNGTGDVTGPGSSTDNAVVRFDLATGKLLQNSGVLIDDGNKLSATDVNVSSLTASRVLQSNASKDLESSSVTTTELGYVSGVTSGIQSQFTGKAALASPTFTGTVTAPTINVSGLTASRAVVTDGSKNLSSSAVTSAELAFLSGVGSSIQDQIDDKADQSLSNLSATAINQDLIPNAVTKKLGSAATYWDTINVKTIYSGTAQDLGITSAGEATLEGGTALYLSTLAGQIYATSTNFTLLNTHLNSEFSNPPTTTPDANLGTGGACAISLGNDVSGVISVDSGSASTAAGLLCTVTFDVPYVGTPSCVLSPGNSAYYDGTKFYSSATSTTLLISAGVAPVVGTTYLFNFHCIDTN